MGARVSSAWSFKLPCWRDRGRGRVQKVSVPLLQTPHPGGLDSMAAVSTLREPAGERAGRSGGDRGRGEGSVMGESELEGALV